jgi:hypothetical protein
MAAVPPAVVHPHVRKAAGDYTTIATIGLSFLQSSHDSTGAKQRGMNAFYAEEVALDGIFHTDTTDRDSIAGDAATNLYSNIIAGHCPGRSDSCSPRSQCDSAMGSEHPSVSVRQLGEGSPSGREDSETGRESSVLAVDVQDLSHIVPHDDVYAVDGPNDWIVSDDPRHIHWTSIDPPDGVPLDDAGRPSTGTNG